MLFYAGGAVMQTEQSKAIDKGMRSLWFIWAAMFWSLLIYVFICHQPGIGFKGGEGTALFVPLLRKILFGVAAAELIMAYYLRRFMLKGRSSVAGAHIVRGSVTLNQPPFVGHYCAAVIISLAFSESIGIYGFVLFMFGGEFTTLYIFMAVSALAMVFYRPKREELEKLAMAYNKQPGASPEI
jgi:hypothetical protein